jgi:plasmid stability protein
MATLTIRNLSDRAYTALKARAAGNQRSMEAEARLQLEQCNAHYVDPADAAAAVEELRDMLRAANGGKLPTGLVDELIADRRAEAAAEEAEARR